MAQQEQGFQNLRTDPGHPQLVQTVWVDLVTVVSPPLVREKLLRYVHIYLFVFP